MMMSESSRRRLFAAAPTVYMIRLSMPISAASLPKEADRHDNRRNEPPLCFRRAFLLACRTTIDRCSSALACHEFLHAHSPLPF